MALDNQNSNQIDEQLLARRSQSSAEKAGGFRQARRDSPTPTPAANNEDKSLRESVMENRRTEEQQEQTEEKKKKPSPINSMGIATSNLLKSSWINLVPSFGLTLIWINIHVFLGTVFGKKLFCKLGMEWLPGDIKKTNIKQAEKLGMGVGTFEGMGLACLDLGCLLLIIVIFIIVAGLLNVIQNPLSFLSEAFGWVWDNVIKPFGKS